MKRNRRNSSSHIDDPSRENSNKLQNFPDPGAEVPLLLPLTSKLTGIDLQQQPLREVDRPQRPDHHQYRVIGPSGENRSVCGGTGTAAQFCCWCRSCHRRHRGQDSAPMTSQDTNSLCLQTHQRRENGLTGTQTDQSGGEGSTTWLLVGTAGAFRSCQKPGKVFKAKTNNSK